ncbi:hypothetical protein [Flavobacterium lindanitolerans]|uniref:hypothetical protein n=1 Tax=Flavobacterium lindanitolerans TaxID=428988 RepID=UPI0023F3A887|nr:hypothetical protein [Flavobacterium lindanitolerans]
MRLDNYAEILRYFEELGYPLALFEKIELKEELSDVDERKFFFKIYGQINGSDYSACFKLVRPKYENYFAIREYQFVLGKGSEEIKQIFPVMYEDLLHPDRLRDPITKEAAYNLVSGRSVYFDEIRKWVQLDFKRTDENGSFQIRQFARKNGLDIEKVVSRYPITELAKEDSRLELLQSLRKGNLQSVSFLIEDREQKKFIEASPQFKTINIYDSSMKREVHQYLNEGTKGQTSGPLMKHSQSAAIPDKNASGLSEQKKRTPRQSR